MLKRAVTTVVSVAGMSLILAYNRGLFDKLTWSDLSPDWIAILQIGALLLLMGAAIQGLVRLSYKIWPKRH